LQILGLCEKEMRLPMTAASEILASKIQSCLEKISVPQKI
jgi:hypothetical protein